MFQRNQDFNIILQTDSYKFSHWRQYPPNTRTVYSYMESRGGQFEKTVFFGLQYYIQRYLEGQVITRDKIEEAAETVERHLGPGNFNKKGWEYILNEHRGILPISIKAVPEGSVVPVSNVLMTVENTDPNCYWLTNYLETMLVQTWYTISVCTLSYHIKKIILGHLERSGTPEDIDFKFHDFGYRGVSSQESAGLGGAAHLVNFKGTDTVAALELIHEYYQEDMAGFSIPAAEHSTITSWGREHEVDAFNNMLEKHPSGLVAVVSDSFNIWEACSKIWGETLRENVLRRQGTLVIRPDSGEPVVVVNKVLDILGEKFGFEVNSKGFKVLDPHVRVIQGDGVDIRSVAEILSSMAQNGWSADNIAFGCGGGLLQKINRDTQKFAFKCSSIDINGQETDVYKDPITDQGKRSKKGKLRLDRTPDGGWITIGQNDKAYTEDQLVEVFHNGVAKNDSTFEEIRKRTEK